MLGAGDCSARVFLTKSQALELAFPAPAAVERRTAYLDAEKVVKAEKAARVRIEARVWTYYVGEAGYAYFETHLVRTQPETFMVVLEPGGTVKFVEILSFLEPEDYLPRARWLGQFSGKTLGPDLMVGRAVRNVSGASLTSAALADGVRRVLAVHALIREGKP